MNLIERAKNIIVTPKTEWIVVSNEKPNTAAIITGYVLPLAAIAAIAGFIGYAFIGYKVPFFGRISGMNWGIYQGVSILVSAVISVLLSAFIIDILAPNFSAEKNMDRSVQLVAYAYTPAWIGGIFSIIPELAFLGFIAGIYGLYLLYLGLSPIKKAPADKEGAYFVVSLLTMIVSYALVFWLVGKVLMSIFGLSYKIPGL